MLLGAGIGILGLFGEVLFEFSRFLLGGFDPGPSGRSNERVYHVLVLRLQFFDFLLIARGPDHIGNKIPQGVQLQMLPVSFLHNQFAINCSGRIHPVKNSLPRFLVSEQRPKFLKLNSERVYSQLLHKLSFQFQVSLSVKSKLGQSFLNSYYRAVPLARPLLRFCEIFIAQKLVTKCNI